MKWMVPINNLDVIQAKTIDHIVKNRDENHWVKGFAGTGKTIVLTHVETMQRQHPIGIRVIKSDNGSRLEFPLLQ